MHGVRGVLHNDVKKCLELTDATVDRQSFGPLTVRVYNANWLRWSDLSLEESVFCLRCANGTMTWCRLDLRR